MNDHHRTSQRIVIVGGGVAGLSVAVRLAQAGLPVTVLEASKLGAAASTRNQGWLHSGGLFASSHTEMARLCYRSLSRTLRFCPDAIEPNHTGMAYLISRADTPAATWTTAWTRAGIPYQELPRETLLDKFDGLADTEVQHAFLLPDRAMRTDVLLAHLAATAENHGAEIRSETSIVRLEHADGSVQSVVTGSGEEIETRLVVYAGGAAGLSLLSEFSHPRAGEQAGCEIVTLKAHLIATKPELGRLPFCVLDAEGFNHIPHALTSVFGINRWVPVGNPTDQQSDPSEVELLWAHVARFFPRFDSAQYECLHWAGTTVQAMHAEQIEPGRAPLPTVIDHANESPRIGNLVSVFPGRATLWVQLAESACKVILEKLGHALPDMAQPPWEHSE